MGAARFGKSTHRVQVRAGLSSSTSGNLSFSVSFYLKNWPRAARTDDERAEGRPHPTQTGVLAAPAEKQGGRGLAVPSPAPRTAPKNPTGERPGVVLWCLSSIAHRSGEGARRCRACRTPGSSRTRTTKRKRNKESRVATFRKFRT